jgi:hypothetical protein
VDALTTIRFEILQAGGGEAKRDDPIGYMFDCRGC